MQADHAYLWSKSRAKLRSFLADSDIDGVDLFVFPAHGGWRSLGLGAAVASRGDVSSASIHSGKTGEPYVRLELTHPPRTPQPSGAGPKHWAAVLDGEVVATFRRSRTGLPSTLNLTCPEHVSAKSARRSWARQVAGRLAAKMSIPLVEVSDATATRND